MDGCCDHRVGIVDEDLHRHAVENLAQADALLFGRVTYEMMEVAWRPPAPAGTRPDWMEPFARTIDAAKKYVVSSTLDRVDWNAELVRGDLGKAVQQLKREPGRGLFTGGVKLPLALAELGLIDEYTFVVHPRLAGHGPTLFAGLSKHIDLKLVSRLEFGSGAVAMRYEPRRDLDPGQTQHGKIASQFAKALVAGNFDQAHEMLTTGAKAKLDAAALRGKYLKMVEYFPSPPNFVQVLEETTE